MPFLLGSQNVGKQLLIGGLAEIEVSYLVIAGGGGAGGSNYSTWTGGGGAGGYRNSWNNETSGRGAAAETPIIVERGTAYTITVGSGSYTTGGNSVFGAITSSGGGHGGRGPYGSSPGPSPGTPGGSGGGGGGANYPAPAPSQGGPGSGTTGQGYNGGSGASIQYYTRGGGGGGAGGNGLTGPTGSADPVQGGAGQTSTITGSSVTRAGGGGGGASGLNLNWLGGQGSAGGGRGSARSYGTNYTGNHGTANTGSGGGGQGYYLETAGYAGGSGIVILRFLDGISSFSVGGGLTYTSTTNGDDRILTFTAGSDTITWT
jgi:hypothetical protein